MAFSVVHAASAGDPWLHLSVASSPATTVSAPSSDGPVIVPAMAPAVLGELGVGGDEEPTPMQRAESVACLVTGGAATAAALAFGWQNVTNLISGGIVPAAGPGAIALGLFGVVFTSFCAIGQALTPLYLDLTYDDRFLPPPPAGNPPQAPATGTVSSPIVINARIDAGQGCLTLYTNGPRAGAC